MKHLRFVFVGQAKNAGFRALEEFYLARIGMHHRDSLIHLVKDAVGRDPENMLAKEGEGILACLEKKDFVVVCDERGKSFDSLKFAQKLRQWQDAAQRVNFVVGGAYGLSEKMRGRADILLKLSDFTLPHELARVVTLEQTYRALTILAGKGYHHD